MSSNKKGQAKFKPAGDAFFTLGSKSKTVAELSKRLGNSNLITKRPATAAVQQPSTSLTKKPRLESSSGKNAASSSTTPIGSLSVTTAVPMKLLELDKSWALEPENAHQFGELTYFDDFIKQAKDKNKPKKLGKLICGAIKRILLLNEGNLDIHIDLLRKICDVISEEPALQKNQMVLLAILSFLNNFNLSSYDEALCHRFIQFATTILRNIDCWSPSIIPYVINDSVEKRYWVDKPQANELVLSVFSAFGDLHLPTETMFSHSNLLYNPREDLQNNFQSKFDKTSEEFKSTLNSILDYFERRAEVNADKNLLKTMGFASSNTFVRLLCSKRFDAFHQNAKLQRQSTELLLFIASNIREISPSNQEVFFNMVRLKALKSKQMLNAFNAAIKVMNENCPEILNMLVELVIENEFSASRCPQTMNLLQLLLSINYNEVFLIIAEKLAKTLVVSESSKKIREFIRELVRSLYKADFIKTDFNFSQFAQNIYEAVQDISKEFSPHIQECLIRGCVEVCAMFPFVGVSSNVKEASQLKNKGVTLNHTQLEVLNKFQNQLKNFYAYSIDFLKWAQGTRVVDLPFYLNSLYRLLCLGSYPYFSSIENWPSETEFLQLIRVISDFSFDESLIKSLISGTLGQTAVMLPSQVFEILETLSNRCLSMKSDLSEIDSLLSVKTTETIDLLFEATSYALQDARDRKHAERLALKSLYWKVWELVFIWSCFNRKSLLKLIYDKYPTLRMLIRMVVTKDYNFPPSSFEGKTPEEIKQGNDQARDEEFRIVQKLEQGSIEDLFEENSNSNSSGVRDLLSKVCLREPTGCIRPPPETLYQRLQTLDLEFNFGAAFCESRNPDILFILTNEQGSTQTMSSITNMIANNRESIEQIPLQCLAQFMISTQADSEFVTTRSKLDKAITPETINSIKTRLSGSLNSENSSLEDIKTVLMFIIGQLCAPAIQERDAAISTLQWLLNGSGEKCNSPFLNLPKIQHFGELRNEICIKLSECCMMETSMERNAHYIQFISNHMSSESIHMIAARLTSLVERANEQTEAHKNVRRSLLSFYAEYMKRCSSGKISQAYVEEETHSRVVIELPNSIAKIETSEKVVSAMMKLLCESFADEINSVIDLDGSGKLKDSLHEAIPDRKFLMNIWFPDSANKRAKVTRVSDNSPMDLLPPKLKLKMLAARDEQIVKAALDGVSAKQALEFIQSFGLTPFSCSQLLSILNKSDLDTKTMKLALPYVRAYRLKGAKGSDEFLRRVDSQSDTEIKMEVDDVREVDSDPVQASSQKRWSLDPPPSILHETSKYSALKALIGKPPNEIQKMVDSQPKQTTSSFLVTKPLQKTTSQGNQKIIRDLENKGADDVLKFLSGVMDQNGKLSYSEFEIARLLRCYRRKRPEIVDIFSPEAKNQVLLLFSVRNPPISNLISELTLSASVNTVKGVMGLLLNEFDSRLNAHSILDFVENAVSAKNFYFPSSTQCGTLLDYVLIELYKLDESSELCATLLQQFSSIIESIIEVKRKDVLISVIEKAKSLRDQKEYSFDKEDWKRYKSIQQVLDSLDSKFPGTKSSTPLLQNVDEITSIRELDSRLYFVILDLFNLETIADQQRLEQTSNQLKNYALNKPQVFARQLPLLSTHISNTLQLPMRQIREREYHKLLEFVLQLILTAVPESLMQRDTSLQEIIQAFLNFFEAHTSSRSRVWQTVLDKLSQLGIQFLETRPIEAKDFFTKNVETLRGLGTVYRELNTLKSLMETLPGLNDQTGTLSSAPLWSYR